MTDFKHGETVWTLAGGRPIVCYYEGFQDDTKHLILLRYDTNKKIRRFIQQVAKQPEHLKVER